MPEEKQEGVVVLDEPKVEETPGKFDTEGLMPEEVKMAKDHGFLTEKEEEKKDAEYKKQSDDEAKEDSDADKEEKEKVKPTFEEVDDNQDKLKEYNKNEQALYWRYKTDKRKRQKAQKEVEELRSELELGKVKDRAAQNRLDKIKEALQDENLTVEALQKIIDDGSDVNEADVESEIKTKLKREANEKAEFNERIRLAEEIGLSKYEDFENISELAQDIVKKNPIYQEILDKAFSNSSIDEEALVEQVVAIARLSPDFGKAPKEEAQKEDKDVGKAIDNSKKKVSSASVGGGGGTRAISYADLTVEDAARLTTEQWSKLPENVKKRLLMA